LIISSAASWNEMKMPSWPILQQKQRGSENDWKLKLETLVCSVVQIFKQPFT